jgi:hypothetical protein
MRFLSRHQVAIPVNDAKRLLTSLAADKNLRLLEHTDVYGALLIERQNLVA